jgi:hypothetical protein
MSGHNTVESFFVSAEVKYNAISELILGKYFSPLDCRIWIFYSEGKLTNLSAALIIASIHGWRNSQGMMVVVFQFNVYSKCLEFVREFFFLQ